MVAIALLSIITVITIAAFLGERGVVSGDFHVLPMPRELLSGAGPVSGLPEGKAEFAGRPWVLHGGAGSAAVQPGETGEALPVGRKATHLHFLHALQTGPEIEKWREEARESIETGGPRPERPVVFTYRIRYGDGTCLDAPVRWQEQIEGLIRRTFIPTSRFIADMAWAEVAWTGELDPERDERPVLYAMEWPNPCPDREIESVVPVGARADYGVSHLHALTAEARPLTGRVFYVSPGGSNDAPGSFHEPWASLQRAARVLEAGDTVFVRGGRYEVEEIISPHNSGRDGAWITYAGYPGEVPVLDGFDIHVEAPGHEKTVDNGRLREVMAGRSGTFHVFDRSHIRVKGLHFHRSAYQAISMDALEWWHSDNQEIQGSHHIDFLHNTTYRTVASGLGVWGVPGSECREIRIVGNRILNAFDPELALESSDPGWQADRRDRVRRESGGNDESLDLHNVWVFEVAHNEVSWGAKEGIDCKGQVRHGALHHNYCHDMFVVRGFGGGKVGIYIDSWIADQCDIEVVRNLVERCGTGIRVMNEGGSPHYDVRIHHNLCLDNYWVGIAIRGGKGDGYSHDISAWNNTLWRNGHLEENEGPGGGISVSTPTVQLRNVTVRDNICSENRDYALAHHRKANLEDHNILFERNLCHPAEPGPRFQPGSARVPTTGENPVLAEPLFRDPENYNFRLRPDSPAIRSEREPKWTMGAFEDE